MDGIERGGYFSRQGLQSGQQGELTFIQALAPGAARIRGVGLGIELGNLGFAETLQALGVNEGFQGGWGRALACRIGAYGRNAQADQAPGVFVVAAGDGAHLIGRVLVGAAGLVAVLDAEVAASTLDQVHALCDSAQVGEVVAAQTPI